MSGLEGSLDGIAVVDKQAGWTSHDVVAKARGIFGTRKIGHAGTLDPDATGVLLLGVGRATRLLRFITPLRKQYSGEMVLGSETTTLDASGEVSATYDMAAVQPQQVAEVALAFVGEITQVPPMVSAVKVGGQRLYELARAGKEVPRAARPVTIYSLEVAPLDAQAGVYRLQVTCSSGTFIRSLAADIGTALGGGAHLRALCRQAIGSFHISQAKPLTSVEILPLAEVMRDYASVIVSNAVANRVANGQVLTVDELGATGTGPWAVYGVDAELLAVYQEHGVARVKPCVVMAREHR